MSNIVLEEKNKRRWVNSKMLMLMLQCRTCGEVFPGIYIPEGSTTGFKVSATNADTSHTCSRGHNNDYVTADYMDWSWLYILRATKVIVVTYTDNFRLQEAKSLVESLTDCQVVNVVIQRYLNHSEYEEFNANVFSKYAGKKGHFTDKIRHTRP
jgi:hypothetical protein